MGTMPTSKRSLPTLFGRETASGHTAESMLTSVLRLVERYKMLTIYAGSLAAKMMGILVSSKAMSQPLLERSAMFAVPRVSSAGQASIPDPAGCLEPMILDDVGVGAAPICVASKKVLRLAFPIRVSRSGLIGYRSALAATAMAKAIRNYWPMQGCIVSHGCPPRAELLLSAVQISSERS